MGVLPMFVLLFVMCYGGVFLFRRVIGEDRWSKLMKYRRSHG
jgi:hypothetical protein